MTKLLIYLILIKVVSWGSKPTVWDGDEELKEEALRLRAVLSPLCGMETTV